MATHKSRYILSCVETQAIHHLQMHLQFKHLIEVDDGAGSQYKAVTLLKISVRHLLVTALKKFCGSFLDQAMARDQVMV